VIAAVSLIGPSFRFTDESLATARHAVREAAQRLG
jgi:DNA-binding IclR family transcriptional regulator